MNSVLLFSGGLDSLILWKLYNPHPVYVAYGHKYQKFELDSIHRLSLLDPCLQTTILYNRLAIGDLEKADGHIPLRNLLLISTVAAVLEPQSVMIGALLGESSTDKSRWFLGNTSRSLSVQLGRRFRVIAPARSMTKFSLVRKYLLTFGRTEHSVTLLKGARSCYSELEHPCGRCMACFRRWVAMSLNGIYERYEELPWEWEALHLDNSREWWGYLSRARPTEIPGIFYNNLLAYMAIKKVKNERL